VRRRSFALAVLCVIVAGALGLLFVLQGGAQSSGGGGLPRGGAADRARQESLEVPAGTILPMKINHGFSSKNARVGQTITGRIMQNVPLPGGGKIPEGTKVIGTVVSVAPAGSSGGARITLRFNELEMHHRRTAMVTDMRALGSMVEVEEAEIPRTPLDHGTSYAWATLRQIGGDMKYGVGGPVTDSSGETVGKGVFDGVLVHVRAQEGTKCRGALDAEDRLQALWVFSADACGVYGMEGVTIAHAGRTEPVGEIVLAAEKGDIKVRGGSGMLLRVIRE
jgi:hypothetical protein